jgi:3-hydroxy-9,10-secoandrosta-1,3,5(10)-triene-9,17-dione monooxygenase reductase component
VARAFATKRPVAEKFADINWSTVGEVPIVHGAVARIVCSLEGIVPGGDHVIAIGRCLHGEFDDALDPLLFYRSRFTTIATTEESPDGRRTPL